MKSSPADLAKKFEARVQAHLDRIYPGWDNLTLAQKIIRIFQPPRQKNQPAEHWSQRDMILITYGDSITASDEKPLVTLKTFLKAHLADHLTIVHVLPFFPYSSDDGFAVMDYYKVNPVLGDWHDITAIAEDFRLMGDLVINHTSSRCIWFENFKKGLDPGKEYYVCVSRDADISKVIRPRTSPLLREVQTPEGVKQVWCTFSHDQVDLDFRNTHVLIEFMHIIRFYLDKGIQIFRLDAVAFLWKEMSTTCLHLNQTHEIIKLLRTVIEDWEPSALIITETNVPSAENLSYLGKGDEAHIIYNFPLPPLLLNTMATGDSSHLVQWLISVPHLLPGTCCLNFLASHDGIGLRPAEGLMAPHEIHTLIDCMKSFGGRVSTRALNDQASNPYEINISLWDAFSGTIQNGVDDFQLNRFICAHAIMLCLQGIPAFYIHSLLGTQNDIKRMENLQNNRAINRHVWEKETLMTLLADKTTHHHKVFDGLKKLMAIRHQQAAFHPQAGQIILKTDPRAIVIQRLALSLDRRRDEEICCIYNISDTPLALDTQSKQLFPTNFQRGTDLISGRNFQSSCSGLTLSPYEFMWIRNQTAPPHDRT
jgi:sucrose phosphorylase